MTVVSEAQYRDRTGDMETPPLTVTARLAEAQELVEEALDRWLESAERTERLRVHPVTDPRYISWTWAGRGYPKAYPVTEVASDDVTAETDRILRVGPAYPDMLVEPWRGEELWSDVTYTGGYTTATLPTSLRLAIIDLAAAMRVSSPVGGAFAGAESVSLGDASVSFGSREDTSPGFAEVDTLVPGMATRLRPWRRRT